MRRLPVYVLSVLAGILPRFEGGAAPVDFESEIRPVFEKKCFSCHGPEKQKSGYRLDVREVALTGGESHAPNVVAGAPERSPLLKFVTSNDSDEQMPPKGERLTAEEVGRLKRWIAEGAQWPDSASVKLAAPSEWWSLKPLARPAVPLTGPANPVDAFVLERLQREGLKPSAPADAQTLCRRIYFDLIGLPPTPEEMDAFVADRAPDALERLVDRLLQSPRYGERWARHWLDVVHYGDTHGYDKDKMRTNAFPYRDYVIRSFNTDKPYARFIKEQIAGDVLYPGTSDGIEALGFLSAGPWDYIGHAEVPETKTDGKIARHLDRDDMVSNTMGSFCATTIHCAQCHNHKFDPITQEDYYSLHAVFAAIDRTEKKYFDDPEQTRQYGVLEGALGRVKGSEAELVKESEKQAGEGLVEIDKQLKEARKSSEPGGNPEQGFHSAISPVQNVVKWVQVDLGMSLALREVLVAGCHDNFNAIGAGFGFPIRYRIEASNDPAFQQDVILVADRSDADQPNPGTSVQKFEAGSIAVRYIRFTATKLAPRKDDYILALAEIEVRLADGKNAALGAAVTSLDSTEAGMRWARKNLTDGIYPGHAKSAADVAGLEKKRSDLLREKVSPEVLEKLKTVRAERAVLEKKMQAFPKPKVAFVGTVHNGSGAFKGTGAEGGKPRPIFLLARGQVTQPGREVGPGALAVLDFKPSRFELPAGASEADRRAALAEWVADSQNPLTWRTMANRVWQYHFGQGLSETPGDFGRNGSKPSHPELLDWLATEFRDSGGSVKQLHRRIMLSDTYRQSSAASAAAAAADGGNRLLWRQNRRKLEAEALRDAILQASGKLDLTMGGPGWQDFVVEQPAHSPHYRYDLSDPSDKGTFRRSVYRFIVRSQTQPWMTSLDCADPSMRVDRRNESLSPLQALALLNNGFLLGQARELALRVEGEAPDLDRRVERAFRLALSRRPSPAELGALTGYAAENGLANTCRLILNLNEFTFVD
jgi:mono/diheme cytochrome c family protein